MRQMKLRLLEIALAAGVVLSGFFYLLVENQLILGGEAAETTVKSVTQTSALPAARGAIVDRNGEALVTSETAFRVRADSSVSQKDLDRLEELREKLDLPAGSGEVVTDQASGAFLAALADWDIDGVTVETWGERVYHTSCAAHLLGRTGKIYPEDWESYQQLGYQMDDIVGVDGLEKAFEEVLRPQAGEVELLTGEDGQVMGERVVAPAQPGNTLALTLDLSLQMAAEEALAEWIPQLEGAAGGACVVVDVSDGGILASASYPTYSLETFQEDYQQLLEEEDAPLYNRAFQGTYAPGSTFKMVTAAAGLEEGAITPETKIKDTGVYTFYEGYQPQCWIYRQNGTTHGWETVSQAIRDSCNVFFYQVGRLVGIDTLNEYASSFGLGEKTGVELAESAGVLAGPAYSESRGSRWYAGNTLAAAIGQSDNLFTPLQLANYVATLANGGTRYQTHLEKEILPPDGGQAEEYTPVILGRVDLSEETVEAIKEGMELVVTEGSLKEAFQNLPITAGAKTGSAQVAGQENSNAVLVCFAPYEEPEIALAVVVENGGSGSELGEIGAEILRQYAK